MIIRLLSACAIFPSSPAGRESENVENMSADRTHFHTRFIFRTCILLQGMQSRRCHTPLRRSFASPRLSSGRHLGTWTDLILATPISILTEANGHLRETSACGESKLLPPYRSNKRASVL